MCPSTRNGAQAEYVCLPERVIALMPPGARFDEAALCEGAFYAKAVLQKIDLKPGQIILIYGASGAIGTAMVQLAKSAGATVTAVVATRQLELVKSLGADRVIDYTSQDYTRIGESFDFVVDAVGKTSFFRCRKLLKRGGIFAATVLGSKRVARLVVRAHPKQPGRHCSATAHRRVCRLSERPYGRGPISSDHRSTLPARKHCRCLPLCRDGAKGWNRRD